MKRIALLFGAAALIILAGLFLLASCGEETEKGQDPGTAGPEDTSENDTGAPATEDTDTETEPAPEREISLPAAEEIKKGDILTFGVYEQDNDLKNGPEPVEWIVLENKDGIVYVVSRYVLDAKRYSAVCKEAQWDESIVREWLNGEFYDAAFNDAEKSLIQMTSVTDPSSPSFRNTEDRIFLMSFLEVVKFFPLGPSRVCVPTPYAYYNGSSSYAGDAEATSWWLRTPGASTGYSAGVSDEGDCTNLSHVVTDLRGVRPAMKLDLTGDK